MKRRQKVYHYTCKRCFYTVDNDEQRIIEHCLNAHGDTGKFKKAFKTIIRRKNI